MVIAILVALLSGATIVTARTVNAGLALETSVLRSTLYNYITGLAVSALVLLVVGGQQLGQAVPMWWWAYLGGVVGVFVIILSNATVAKISSFYMTLLLFIGQVFAGILLDILLTRTISWGNFLGGALVALGLAINMRLGEGPEPSK